MSKTKEELNELKKNYKELLNKLQELSEEELEYIVGGAGSEFIDPENNPSYNPHFYHDDIKDFGE